MPFIMLRTNLALDKAALDEAATKMSAFASKALSKPESYVMAAIEANLAMRFGGSDAPCAYLIMESIGLSVDACPDLSRKMCAFMEETLSIPPERLYIRFTDLNRSMFGWNSKTFG